ncbi:MAG: hypothetical protein WCW65_01305 [Candidatus Paceibacterota bacterium]
MHTKYNKFLIVSFIIVSIFGIYSYFYNDLKSEAAVDDEDASLTSSLDSTAVVPTPTSSSNQLAEDTAFLSKLASLTTIKVDTTLFTDKAFELLKDNNIRLEPVPYGRINPFAPTESAIASNRPAIILKTNPPTLITNRSVVLNGSLEGATSDNLYFEYGVTQALGRVTPKATPSLVGSFASNVIGLATKTQYFFRAVANVNGNIILGDIIPFYTN